MNIIIPFKASYIKILMLFLFFISSFYFNKPSYGKYASIIMNEKSGKVYHSINADTGIILLHLLK